MGQSLPFLSTLLYGLVLSLSGEQIEPIFFRAKNVDARQWLLESPSCYRAVKAFILSVKMGKELSTALHECLKKDGSPAFATAVCDS